MPTLFDLTAQGASQTVNGAVITDTENVNSGTGIYDTFLAIGDNDGNESGFNSDFADSSNPDISAPKTHTLQIGNLVVQNINGVDYYEVRLDLNEVASGDNAYISLDQLKIYTSSDGTLSSLADLGALTPVYDLDSGGDKTLLLTQDSSGSGTDDYSFFIPVSLFTGLPNTTFVYVYADMGEHDVDGFDASDGFDEFRALTQDFTPIPRIEILKETNDTDGTCPNILVGEDVTWTYTITNPGDLELANVVVTDDNGTPLDTTDDFHPTYVSGDADNDGKLDTNETWIYTASLTGGAVAGEYTNIAYVTGDWSFGGNSGSVNSSEGDCYFGANPEIDIVKMTNGTDDLFPVVSVGDTVTWTYNVTNPGNVPLSNVVVTDDNGTPANLGDDFNPDAVLGVDLVHNIGDVNNDGILDLTETWQYTATGTAVAGSYHNTATVTGDFTDDFGHSTTVNASEDDGYLALEGCVRTPGFWQNPNNGGQFWDGTPNNENHAGEDHFPTGELLYPVDSNHDGTAGGAGDVAGLLIGDYNHDGLGTGEDVIFISLTDALALINANNKQMSDGVVKIGRDVVATWLNYLSGAGIGTVDSGDGAYSPKEAINDAINYLQIFGDLSSSNAASSETFDTYSSSHNKVLTSSGHWNNDYPGGSVSGSEIHSALDGYNNTGTIDGVAYAADCDDPQLLSELSGFSVNGLLSLNSVSLI